MSHPVYAIATDHELDILIGGQAHATEMLRPQAWDSLEPALTYAYDELLIEVEECIEGSTVEYAATVAAKSTKRAILFKAASRIFELAATEATEQSIYLRNHKAYDQRFASEVVRICDKLAKAHEGPPGPRRGPMVIDLGRA